MKSRIGFVSNSSSCSFIVSIKDFATTIAVADAMLNQRYEWHRDGCEDMIKYLSNPDHKDHRGLDSIETYKKELKDNEETYLKLMQNLLEIGDDGKHPPNLAFSSCNFDTFITEIEVADEKYIYVATCNNVGWDFPKVVPQIPREPCEKGSVFCYYSEPEGFNAVDLYDGHWDDNYIQGATFTVIDDKTTVCVKNKFKGIRQNDA